MPELITGTKGTPHITSTQDRAIYEKIIGKNSYILDDNELLEPELQSNQSLRIRSGMLYHHGSITEVKRNTYDEVTIANGSQGMKRIDLVVARYTKNPETEIEEMNWVVIQGTPAASDPVAPAYIEGNMQEGDLTDDCPVFEVHLDGIQVTEVVKLLTVLSGSLEELNSKLPIITPMEPYKDGVIDLHGLKIVYGTYPLNGFVSDSESGGYKASIDISSHHLTGDLWCAVTPRYPLGHPYVSVAEVTPENITLLSDAIVQGAYAAWMVIGVSS